MLPVYDQDVGPALRKDRAGTCDSRAPSCCSGGKHRLTRSVQRDSDLHSRAEQRLSDVPNGKMFTASTSTPRFERDNVDHSDKRKWLQLDKFLRKVPESGWSVLELSESMHHSKDRLHHSSCPRGKERESSFSRSG